MAVLGCDGKCIWKCQQAISEPLSTHDLDLVCLEGADTLFRVDAFVTREHYD